MLGTQVLTGSKMATVISCLLLSIGAATATSRQLLQSSAVSFNFPDATSAGPIGGPLTGPAPSSTVLTLLAWLAQLAAYMSALTGVQKTFDREANSLLLCGLHNWLPLAVNSAW